MIITISGKAGSGKSTVAKGIAKKLNLKHYSIGGIMRQLAKEKNLSLNELSKLAEKDKTIDLTLDKKQIGLRDKNDFVIDGRLSFHFIPFSKKIFIKVDEEEGGKRIFKAKRQTEQHESVEQAIKKIRDRRNSELKRYKKYYNVDYTDMKQFDFIIDSTSISAEEVKNKIKEYLSKL